MAYLALASVTVIHTILQMRHTDRQPVVCHLRSPVLSDEYEMINMMMAPDIQMGTVIHWAVTLVYPIVLRVTGMKYDIEVAVLSSIYRTTKKYDLKSASTANTDCHGFSF